MQRLAAGSAASCQGNHQHWRCDLGSQGRLRLPTTCLMAALCRRSSALTPSGNCRRALRPATPRHAHRARHPAACSAALRTDAAVVRSGKSYAACTGARDTVAAVGRQRQYQSFIPAQISEIQEPAALDMAEAMRREPIDVPPLGRAVDTAFVGPDSWPHTPADADAPPFLLIPSFDSSILEYRRLYPLLAAQRRAFAMDTVGWGFTDASFITETNQPLGPLQKREHLHAFYREKIGRPAVVVGTSIGGATALDFALTHPEDVAALVLIDAQGFIDGIGPMAKLPRWASRLGVQVLKTERLRQAANEMAYFDSSFPTRDAMLVGRLNTHMPGWMDANVAFMQSGGYTGIGAKVPTVEPPVLVLWGRHDRILPPETAHKFADALPAATVTFLEKSGHSGHLEEPRACADHILNFADSC